MPKGIKSSLNRLTKQQLSYLAGLLDGRGSIGAPRKTITQNGIAYKNVAVYVRITGKPGKNNVVEVAHKIVGGCLSLHKNDTGRKVWVITGTIALGFLKKLLPHIKTNKRKKEIKDVFNTYKKYQAELKERARRRKRTHKKMIDASNETIGNVLTKK